MRPRSHHLRAPLPSSVTTLVVAAVALVLAGVLFAAAAEAGTRDPPAAIVAVDGGGMTPGTDADTTESDGCRSAAGCHAGLEIAVAVPGRAGAAEPALGQNAGAIGAPALHGPFRPPRRA